MIDASAAPYNINATVTDNAPVLGPLLQKAAATGELVVLPPGEIKLASLLPPFSNLPMLNLLGQRTMLTYTGAAPGILFNMTNVAKFYTDGVFFEGNGNKGVTLVSQSLSGSPGGLTPTQWGFKRGGFEGAGVCFDVPGTPTPNNCDGTLFEQMTFTPAPGGRGWQCMNPNSLANTFLHCDMGGNNGGANGAAIEYSIYCGRGSFTTIGAQFGGAGVGGADIYINPDGPCAVRGGWSQNSYRHVMAPFRTVPISLTIEDISISSFPANWVANNPNDAYAPIDLQATYAQRGAIYCDVQNGLGLRNVRLLDPIKWLPVYAVSVFVPAADALQWTNERSYTTSAPNGVYESQLFNQSGTVS